MTDGDNKQFKGIPLEEGGDLHWHANQDGTITSTAQLPGGVSIHDNFDSDIEHCETSVTLKGTSEGKAESQTVTLDPSSDQTADAEDQENGMSM